MWSKLFANPFLRAIFLLSVLVSLVFIVKEIDGVKQRIGNIVFDTYINMSPRPASDKLIFVDINDESLSRVGQWPWPRTKIAQLVKNINKSGASVIIFDGVIAEPDRTSPDNVAALLGEGHPAYSMLKEMPSNDAVLAQAIKEAGNFVAGFTAGSNPNPPMVKSSILIKASDRNSFLGQTHARGLFFKNTAQFLPALQRSAAGNGSFMATEDITDSVIRHTRLFFIKGKTLYPSLILEGLRLSEKSRTNTKIFQNKSYNDFKINEPFTTSVGQYIIPTSADGKMWIHYRKFLQDEFVAAYHFLDEFYEEEAKDLSGKIVFIASSAEGLMDLRSTPIGFQAGVIVHMNVMEQIIQNRFLIRPYLGEQLEIMGAILVSILIILASFFVGPLWLASITILASAGAFLASWHIFLTYGGLVDPVTPAIMVISIFIAASVMSFIKTEMERRQVSTAFGHYISPDFMKELTADPDKLKLGGEIRDLTVLFSDIRSFTTISEGLTPEELIQLMNDFLTPMTDLVMQNKGTIDKYMGDAMMAFWNAPLDDEHHERHACISALKMQAALEPINEGVRKKALELGKEPVLLRAGIGINTGPCAVGNMGSRQRFAYSALGDAVNLAARLEGQTKTYTTEILIGRTTNEAVPDFATLEFDLIQVKGKTKAEHIYGLLGDKKFAKTPEFITLAAKHKEMISCYRAQKFKEAQELIKECMALSEDNLVGLYTLYKERTKEMIKNPPDKDWAGVFVATSK